MPSLSNHRLRKNKDMTDTSVEKTLLTASAFSAEWEWVPEDHPGARQFAPR